MEELCTAAQFKQNRFHWGPPISVSLSFTYSSILSAHKGHTLPLCHTCFISCLSRHWCAFPQRRLPAAWLLSWDTWLLCAIFWEWSCVQDTVPPEFLTASSTCTVLSKSWNILGTCLPFPKIFQHSRATVRWKKTECTLNSSCEGLSQTLSPGQTL